MSQSKGNLIPDWARKHAWQVPPTPGEGYRDLPALWRCPTHYRPTPAGLDPEQAVIEVLKTYAA